MFFSVFVQISCILWLNWVLYNIAARDIQAWETIPLGPFLGKSFSKTPDAFSVILLPCSLRPVTMGVSLVCHAHLIGVRLNKKWLFAWNGDEREGKSFILVKLVSVVSKSSVTEWNPRWGRFVSFTGSLASASAVRPPHSQDFGYKWSQQLVSIKCFA